MLSLARFLKRCSGFLAHAGVRVLYPRNMTRFAPLCRSGVDTGPKGSCQMSLIDKACRLSDVGKGGDSLSKHCCRSFQPLAPQIVAGRASKESSEHACKMN